MPWKLYSYHCMLGIKTSYIATQVAIAVASYTLGNLDKDCNSIASRYSKYTEGYMEHVRSMKQRPVL